MPENTNPYYSAQTKKVKFLVGYLKTVSHIQFSRTSLTHSLIINTPILPVYEQVLLKIQDFLKDSHAVLDLYAGVGTIGLSVARNTNLTLVEVNASAFGELKTNSERAIQETKNPHIKPIFAKSEEVLDLITQEASVIVDPPRAGCDENLINRLCEVQPEKIVYLSCNPITQVRDLKPLLEYYNLKYIEGYNFFPHTPHIESLVFLFKKS